MEINIIAAVAKNRAIGYNNDMVYFIKEDLRRFKQLTTGHTVSWVAVLSTHFLKEHYPIAETSY